MSYFPALILICVFGDLVLRETTFASFLDGNNIPICDQHTTFPGCGIVVKHSGPSRDRGTVVIESSLNKSLGLTDPMCTWSYKVQGVTITKQQELARGSDLSWIFSKSGLQKVSVTAQFDHLGNHETIKNCTFVNVTDCYLVPKVKVSTSTGSYNISQNHTDVTSNSPGLVNFTVSVFTIDPYFICKHLYFFWDLGDGHNTLGKHIEHYYNNTGVYCVVLNIYKVLGDDGKEFIRNFTMKLHVKEKHTQTKSTETVVDISLVLSIFFVCFVFVICITVYWFRRRLHRHTEVARFDFRDSEFQSSVDGQCTGISSNGKWCINAMTCRRGSNEYLLNFEQNRQYSSCRRFGGNALNEEL